MVVVAVSGSVGSGKTTISKEVAKKLDFQIIHLNDVAKKFKIEDVDEIQTFDFDLDALLLDLENELKVKKSQKENIILEGHFAHFISPSIVDVLFIINRDLKDLKEEYKRRKYVEQKIKDNLEVESFNLCFYEAEEEGYNIASVAFNGRQTGEIEENLGVVYSINNDKSLTDIVEKVCKKIKIIEENKK